MSELFEAKSVVIGAGIVGLAIARELAIAGFEPLILERHDGIGQETSSRNSEVIHAGIYYPPGSAKARHCARGRDMLYDYCRERSIAHRQCGKLIVACDMDEVSALEGIAKRASLNGASLDLLDGSEARSMEPNLCAAAALHSPVTGIVDSHALMLSLLGDAQDAGANLALSTSVLSGECGPDEKITLNIGGNEPCQIVTPFLVNAAGLNASRVAVSIYGLPEPPRLQFVKGNYFTLNAASPFQRLIYPAPRDGGLGIHLTLDLAGRARFGPDTEWLEESDPEQIDYTVTAHRLNHFEAEIRRYWPELPVRALQPDYTGIRPKLSGETYPDFRIDDAETHGVSGYVGLYGIESPGLTSALSIAREVCASLQK